MPLQLKRILALIVLGCALLTTAAQTGDPVVIQMQGESITRSALEQAFERAARSITLNRGMTPTPETLAQLSSYRSEFLEQYATRLALLEAAEAQGVRANPDIVEGSISRLRGQHADFNAHLRDLGFDSEAAYRDHLLAINTAQLMGQTLISSVQVSNEEVEAWYRAHEETLRSQNRLVPLDEMRSLIHQRLLTEKQNQSILSLRDNVGMVIYRDLF